MLWLWLLHNALMLHFRHCVPILINMATLSPATGQFLGFFLHSQSTYVFSLRKEPSMVMTDATLFNFLFIYPQYMCTVGLLCLDYFWLLIALVSGLQWEWRKGLLKTLSVLLWFPIYPDTNYLKDNKWKQRGSTLQGHGQVWNWLSFYLPGKWLNFLFMLSYELELVSSWLLIRGVTLLIHSFLQAGAEPG